MKAAQLIKYGGSDSVKVNEVDKPTIKSDQVLIEVKAASINPFDLIVREGFAKQMVDLEFPATIGGDLSGVVVEVGSEVTDLEVGQEVYGQAGPLSRNGSFAEFAPASPGSLASKPEGLDFINAAAYPLVAVSAYQGLVDHIKLLPEQKILIHGGGGGIGSLAIQLAKHLGAYVATTVGTEDLKYAKQLGADQVIDYKSQDFAEIIHDFDAVFDTVGGETATKSYGVLKAGGMLVSMAAPPQSELAEKHEVTAIYQSSQVNTERLEKIGEIIEAGLLKVNIDKTFPLDQAAEAMEYLKTNHVRGKVVIAI